MSAPFSNHQEPGRPLTILQALAGMRSHGGKFTADQWKAKTGHDPRQFPCWFYVSPVNQFCIMTPEGRQTLDAHNEAVRSNWHALGISC